MTEKELFNLLNDMSFKEKIGQLNQLAGSFFSTKERNIVTGPLAKDGLLSKNKYLTGSVLGIKGAEDLIKIQKDFIENHPHKIPMLFMADVINGFETIFPVPLAQSCSFNPDLIKKAARITAIESAVSGLHVTFSPMVDLVRDARWGRVMESTGEDTYLNSIYAKAMVEGYQGGELKDEGSIAACVKHFAGYGAPTAGREYNNVELSTRTLYEDYMPAYKAAIDSDCAMVMTSFNTIDRVPVTANKDLLRTYLRKTLNFSGVVISDWQAIEELIYHTIAQDGKEAAELAIQSGVDIDMMSGLYLENLETLLEKNLITMDLIDESVMNILQLKNRLGLFENPFKDANILKEKEIVFCKEHNDLAKELTIKSIVLLKNEKNILPIIDKSKNIALIGPYIDSKETHGAWSIFADKNTNISILEGFKNLNPENDYEYSKGCEILDKDVALKGFEGEIEINKNDPNNLCNAVKLAEKSDIVIMAIGEHRLQSGEAASRVHITVPKIQEELFNEIYKVNKNIIVILFNGRPLELENINSKAKSILEVWLPGTQGGNAIANIVFGKESPSGKLTMSFPRSVGQCPIFYNEFSTGRPHVPNKDKDRFRSKYIDSSNSPLFPFGYGLTYSTCKLGDISIDKDTISLFDQLTSKITIKNIGNFKIEETVQLYIKDCSGSVVRPGRELKGFKKVYIEPGEEAIVEFIVKEDMLRFIRHDNTFGSESGWFVIYIGLNSVETKEIRFYLSK